MKTTYKIFTCSIGAMAFTILTCLPAAALTFVTERSALQATDRLDWASLGKVFTGVPNPSVFLDNSFTTTTDSGLGLTVEIPPATTPGVLPPFVFQTLRNGIETNFTDGDFVLFTGLLPSPPPAPGNPGPITLIFDQPVAAVGSQLAVDDIFHFTGSISVFDTDGLLLNTFEAPGSSSLALDNSAAFFGVTSDQSNIARVAFSSSVANSAIGINDLSIVLGTDTTSIPEPGMNTAALVLAVGLMVVGKRRSLS